MIAGETICEPKTGAAADYINFLDMQTGERQGGEKWYCFDGKSSRPDDRQIPKVKGPLPRDLYLMSTPPLKPLARHRAVVTACVRNASLACLVRKNQSKSTNVGAC